MAISIFPAAQLILLSLSEDPWIPSQAFLRGLLVIGALFLAGVFLSAFTYYEDHYWADSKFREELRDNSSRRDS